MPRTENFMRCPLCRASLTSTDTAVRCHGGHEFPSPDGTIDLIGGASEDQGSYSSSHACEAGGMTYRAENYILPWMRKHFDPSTIRVLEDGCGVGDGVEYLVGQGIDAWGIDVGLRSEAWNRLAAKDRLLVADGTNLPFNDETFDVVTSSGVLEHVGEPRGRREQHPFQRAYMTEIVRVLKPGGRALIAQPNGAHPIDYWHPPANGTARLHFPYEAWMPNSWEIRRWARSAPHPVDVRFLSPEGYLAFERVKAHWYGRVFSGAMRGLFSTITRVPALATTPLNPWLVAEVVRLP